jgi:hypothetical protein
LAQAADDAFGTERPQAAGRPRKGRMGERRIESIEGLNEGDKGAAKPDAKGAPGPARDAAPAPPPVLVDVNYPDPTLLTIVVRDVAKWSGQCFVMEPSVNAKIQIFAPRKLSPTQAYELFLVSLSVINLRAVQVGNVVKIVPVGLPVSA